MSKALFCVPRIFVDRLASTRPVRIFLVILFTCFGALRMRRAAFLTAVAIVAMVTFVPASTQAAPRYTVIDIGDLPGGDYSMASAINDNGQVVGDSVDDGWRTAFVWEPGTGLRSLGIPGGHSEACSINDSGTVVGKLINPSQRGGLWDASSHLVDLGTAHGGPYSVASAINDNGFIVQNDWSWYGAPGAAYLRSPSGVVTNIGTAPGLPAPYGEAINNHNQIVGCNWGSWWFGYNTNWNSRTGTEAFLWDPVTGLTLIGHLPGSDYTVASGINEAGTVVGTARTASGSLCPFIWDATSGIRALENVCSPGLSCGANDINDADVVVGYVDGLSSRHACLWTPDAGMVDLNDCVVDSVGWQYLEAAAGINNHGQIVGYGTLTDGSTHAFLLSPTSDPVPEPTTLLLLATCGIFWRRKNS